MKPDVVRPLSASRVCHGGSGHGRAEEWVQTEYRSFLTKLGVTTTESAHRGTNASLL
jgi:hypothetical protein